MPRVRVFGTDVRNNKTSVVLLPAKVLRFYVCKDDSNPTQSNTATNERTVKSLIIPAVNRRWMIKSQSMECLLRFANAPAVATISTLRFNDKSKTKKHGVLLRAKLDGENDPLLQSAVNAASLRFQETHRPGMSKTPLLTCLY